MPKRFRNAFREQAVSADEGEWQRVVEALEDDFDTPRALAVLHEWASAGQLEPLGRALALFGLASLAEQAAAPDEIVRLADQRVAARAARDFESADRLRDEIEAAGWEMRDGSDGYTLVQKR